MTAVHDPQRESLPADGLAELDVADCLACDRISKAAEYRSPQAAAVLAHALPRLLLTLPELLRGLLIRCLHTAVLHDPQAVAAALPLIGAIVRLLPEESRQPLLERIARLAQVFPIGVVRLFRALPRAYEEGGADRVIEWIVSGEEIARRNPQAGEAYFALDSRTSVLLLRHASPSVLLSDVQGMLHKYVHMLCGATLSIQETESAFFPPPLAEEEGTVIFLPACVESFPTYEENLRWYGVLAAHQAGRLEFGTYDFSPSVMWPALTDGVRDLIQQAVVFPDDLTAYFRCFPWAGHIESLFLLIEGKRISARLAALYRGLVPDLAWADEQTTLLSPTLSSLLSHLPAGQLELHPQATVYDAVLLATELAMSLLAEQSPQIIDGNAALSMSASRSVSDRDQAMLAAPFEESSGKPSLSAEELAELYQRMAALREQHGERWKQEQEQRLPLPMLARRVRSQESEQEGEESAEQEETHKQRRQRRRGPRYLYDEWDYVIEDYRPGWCHLREYPLLGDSGGFFDRTMTAYAHLLPNIKREFQRLRPRLYKQMKGVEDGQEIDLEAAVTARVDVRTGISPSPKLYTARQPMERDVAALFLLDLSASTQTPLAAHGDVRIIDLIKESVVLLSAALEHIGDSYAIYGFSSAGRYDVEVYPVKTFAETLSPAVKGRMSALAPMRSTRMGTAVRHAMRKLKEVSCRAKLLVLLSDGYPEDTDYGRDPHVPTYGLRDTMMALREAERTGILSFCLTVDQGGHDYLRQMCAPSRYMVIDDVSALPTELPKIYQRHIRSREEHL